MADLQSLTVFGTAILQQAPTDPSGACRKLESDAALAAANAAAAAAASAASVAASAASAAASASSAAAAAQAFAIQRGNHTGTQSADTVIDGTANKAFTAAEKTKLAGIATAATANSADATLLNRANHTGTQLLATISDAADLAVIEGLSGTGFAKRTGSNAWALVQDGVANGLATLGSDGKLATSQIPAALLGDTQYQDVWNATTNSPAIPAASSANKGQYYVVNVAGTTTIDGVNDWKIGDWLVSNGVKWDKIDNTDSVTSVAGLVGVITGAALKTALSLVAGDISGLGGAALLNVGTTAGTVAAGNDSRLTDARPMKAWNVVAVNTTAVAGENYVSNGDGLELTLPATPTAGQTVGWKDGKGNWDTINAFVRRNGHNINGLAEDVTCQVKGGTSQLSYVDSTVGWRATAF